MLALTEMLVVIVLAEKITLGIVVYNGGAESLKDNKLLKVPQRRAAKQLAE